MVEFAEHFRSKLYSNTLTGLELKNKNVGQNISLLGHSVGAGLATFVAGVAAEEKQPFKKVMYMAPQTQVRKMGCEGGCVWGYVFLVAGERRCAWGLGFWRGRWCVWGLGFSREKVVCLGFRV
jgi:hypothetical protein